LEKKKNDNIYELFLKNLYESGFLKKEKFNEGLLMAALQEHSRPQPVEKPKMLRMRYMVDDYDEFEKYYQERV